jgi:hypothetical protein
MNIQELAVLGEHTFVFIIFFCNSPFGRNGLDGKDRLIDWQASTYYI